MIVIYRRLLTKPLRKERVNSVGLLTKNRKKRKEYRKPFLARRDTHSKRQTTIVCIPFKSKSDSRSIRKRKTYKSTKR